MQLENKVALVVGINNDIGRTTAIAMAQEGAKVAIADEDVVRGEAIVTKILEAGGEACFYEIDITLNRKVKELIEQIVMKYGSLDIAFNNASVEGAYFPLGEQPEGLVARLIDFNFNGTWMCVKHQVQQMLKQNRGVIINNVSIYKTDGSLGCSIHKATKAAVKAMTETAATEYARHNIRLNAIAPAILKKATKLAQGISNDDLNESPSSIIVPMGRGGQFQEVADTVVWLCSDRASYITGHTIPVDGGLKALTN